MMRSSKTVALGVAAMILFTSAGWAQLSQAIRLEWQVSQAAGGPLIAGYIYNDHGVPGRNIRLVVEGLDASGEVVSRTIGYVDRPLPPLSRTYFQVRVPAFAASYRVTVLSVDWRGRDGL